MCGRYERESDPEEIAQAFEVPAAKDELPLFEPNYNIAPKTFQPVVRIGSSGEREIALMQWSLIPFWSKEPKTMYSTFNATAEKLLTSSLWREPFRRRRCLVPANAFYEWPTVDGRKQPHAFAPRDSGVFAFAGLWDRWTDGSSTIESFSIVTTEPSEWMEKYHSRQGMILERKDYARWLDSSDPTQPPIDLLRPVPEDHLRTWRVSDRVGNVRNRGPELIQPVE
jgi:putative SOS response-associated peptidase YedK